MSESKHTPGPWTNHGRIQQSGLPHSSVAAKTLLARVYSEAFGDSEQETANANLIAAAPDLLAAVRAQHDIIDTLLAMLITADPSFRPTKSDIWPRIAAVGAVQLVAKATGVA